jgi:RNA polymerase sigma-70 factor, ECF subfamily
VDTVEQELAERIRGGDIQALAEYVQLVRPRLMAFIERNLGTALRRKLEPEDVLQDVNAEAIRALPKMELGDREPFSWLCQVAERKIIDAHRYHFGAKKRDAGREQPLDRRVGDASQAGLINMLVKSMTTPSQAFSRNAREERLAHALEGLPAEQREALRLRYVEGLPSKQIAEQLGKSDAAVRVMLTRATQRLQSLLAEGEK